MRIRGAVVLLFACMAVPLPARPAAQAPAVQPGTIVDTRSGLPVDRDTLFRLLPAQDVIYLGEEHHNRRHVEAAVSLLQALLDQGRRPVLAMEMFGWDGQEALDRYVSGGLDRTAFLQEARWERNWGGPFEDYEPLIALARARSLTVVALNPPLPLVRRVAKRGLADALFDPDMARWRMRTEMFVDDRPYREAIVAQIRRCHGGMPDDGYERMYQASLFRDEAMARTIADRLAALTAPAGPAVSYTGGGHIQHRLPVPQRVERRRPQSRSLTIYLAALDSSTTDDVAAIIRERVADYVWVTEPGEHGAPQRCG